MEKRKLAKIPREEATDEMVRFSERAAGTHIVTTKDIEKRSFDGDILSNPEFEKRRKERSVKNIFLKERLHITGSDH